MGWDWSGAEPVVPAMTVGTWNRLGILSRQQGQITLVMENSTSMYQRVNHTSRYQYGELELERKAARVFHKVCKDQEDSFCKLLQAHGKHQLAKPRTDCDSGRVHWGQRWKPVGSLAHSVRILISLPTYCGQEDMNFT